MASSCEERIAEEAVKEMTHKTKIIQFLGRTTPIILQNDNGPCPLLAICNVLLLKNNINLSPDISEISQDNLLSLVAERLIDSNSNVDNKDAGYVENQQQNIADAIDLLPRLTTGIDVNIKFKGITEFEFTRECAIFDLLDIPLYHGWIVDPQDHDTYNAIGSKSYNSIMGELVMLETGTVGTEYKKKPEEDSVDFVAATTAALGVPSPGLSRGLSFNDSTGSPSEHNKARKGDIEEEVELLRALKISEAEVLAPSKEVVPDMSDEQNMSAIANESAHIVKSEPAVSTETTEGNDGVEVQNLCQQDIRKSESVVSLGTTEGNVVKVQNSCQQKPSISIGKNDLEAVNDNQSAYETVPEKHDSLPSKNDQNLDSQLSCKDSEECNAKNSVGEYTSILDLQKGALSDSRKPDPLSAAASNTCDSEGTKVVQDQSVSEPNVLEEDHLSAPKTLTIACSMVNPELDTSGDSTKHKDVCETVTSVGDGTEPIYAGEECILVTGTTSYEDREPVYEGEVVLAEQVDKNSENAIDVACKSEITPQQGELIKEFLKTNASQLTVYGLICLQEELKERELCVFFRNNHFNTMFKLGGQLYLLATDQGYINQPDLVWEKLNEVNGNTIFMTGSFKEFKAEEGHANTIWDEQNARASTADYLASMNDQAQDNSSLNSDLQLAMALQEQEFEQQPQHSPQQPQRSAQKQTVAGGSGLVTGPQTSGNRNKYLPQPSRPEPKSSKDKCVVM